jgi:hypothetical protein
MSTIRADNVADRTGAGSIPMNTVSQGTAKAWAYLIGTGVISFTDSFGMSGAIDGGLGVYTFNLATARPSGNYITTDNPYAGGYIVVPNSARSFTTTSFQGGTYIGWNAVGGASGATTDAFTSVSLTGDA